MRLLFAEDDYILAESIMFFLQDKGYVIDWVENGVDAEYAVHHHPYDALIMDLGLPQQDGLQVITRLREAGQIVPIMVLTARNQVEDRIKGLQAGADDYLCKPFIFQELDIRLRALIRRSHFKHQNDIELGSLRYDVLARRLYFAEAPVDLSSKEVNLLEFFLMHSGRILSKQQLIDHLYGWDDRVTFNAIEVYIHRLRKKLDPAGYTFKTVRGMGYVLEKTA